MKYPYWKVLIGFSSCPALASLPTSFYIIFNDVFSGRFWGGERVFSELMASVHFSIIVVPAMAMLFFGVPAVALAVLYLFVKVERTYRGIAFVSCLGGGSGVLWNLIFNDVFPVFLVFSHAAVASFVMAFFVLPKPITMDEDTSEE